LLRFKNTHHSLQRLLERGITESDCRDTIQHPDSAKRMPGKGVNGGKRMMHSKKIGARVLTVVFEIKHQTATIVTAYYES
jgi:hypothetical protein